MSLDHPLPAEQLPAVGQLQAQGLRFDLASSNKLRVASYPIEEPGGQFFIVTDCEVSAP